MRKKVVTSIVVICTILSFFIWKKQENANTVEDYVEAFHKSSFFSGGEVQLLHDEVIQSLYPSLHGITDKSSYIYWYNDNGQIEQIICSDFSHNFPDHVIDEYDKYDAETEALEWFNKAFEQELKIYGKEIRIKSYDFNGGDYTVAIDLLYNGRATGNYSSFCISADGKLMSAGFVHDHPNLKELSEPLAITIDAAKGLAQKYVEEDCFELYGNDCIFYWDELHDLSYETFRWENKNVWDLEFFVPTMNVFKNPEEGKENEIYDLFCFVRINADTGELIWVATPLK